MCCLQIWRYNEKKNPENSRFFSKNKSARRGSNSGSLTNPIIIKAESTLSASCPQKCPQIQFYLSQLIVTLAIFPSYCFQNSLCYNELVNLQKQYPWSITTCYIGFMNFAKKCKELWIKKVATQEQMAIALNLYSQAVSKWKNRDWDIIVTSLRKPYK